MYADSDDHIAFKTINVEFLYFKPIKGGFTALWFLRDSSCPIKTCVFVRPVGDAEHAGVCQQSQEHHEQT